MDDRKLWFDSQQAPKTFILLAIASRLAMRHKQPPTQRLQRDLPPEINWSKRDNNHSLVPSD